MAASSGPLDPAIIAGAVSVWAGRGRLTAAPHGRGPAVPPGRGGTGPGLRPALTNQMNVLL